MLDGTLRGCCEWQVAEVFDPRLTPEVQQAAVEKYERRVAENQEREAKHRDELRAKYGNNRKIFASVLRFLPLMEGPTPRRDELPQVSDRDDDWWTFGEINDRYDRLRDLFREYYNARQLVEIFRAVATSKLDYQTFEDELFQVLSALYEKRSRELDGEENMTKLNEGVSSDEALDKTNELAKVLDALQDFIQMGVIPHNEIVTEGMIRKFAKLRGLEVTDDFIAFVVAFTHKVIDDAKIDDVGRP